MDVKAPPDAPTRETPPETIVPLPGQEMPPPKRTRFALSPINRRRWQNFRANRRGFWSLWIFLVLFVLSLFAEFLANDRPILVSYKGEMLFPVFIDYPEEKFGGFLAVTDYRAPFVQDEIEANGWIALAADPLFLPDHQQRDPGAGAGASLLDARQGDALQRATRRASTTGTARPGTGTGSAPTTRRATWWRGSSTASASRCCSASR